MLDRLFWSQKLWYTYMRHIHLSHEEIPMSSTSELSTVPWLPSIKYLVNITSNRHELYELIVLYQTLALVTGLFVVCLFGMVSAMCLTLIMATDVTSSPLIGASIALLVGSVIFAVASGYCLLDLRQSAAKTAHRNAIWTFFVSTIAKWVRCT